MMSFKDLILGLIIAAWVLLILTVGCDYLLWNVLPR